MKQIPSVRVIRKISEVASPKYSNAERRLTALPSDYSMQCQLAALYVWGTFP